ncbi:hypothetical protein NIES23_63870 (plasmid) [Trichormus variabilis NIES-23]|uniref:Uncharacterized protein n=1 Tax=Trichormus variabilis NIES-23 TaxID=1973479 RepID=A0A1Z4KX40_ANAVA|nr:hypothetical protein NIES23_63870 [Trichormus variabilis NIES-23]
MSKLPTLSQTVNTVVTSMTAFIVLATVTTTPAVAALFNFKFDGTLTGSDPFGTAATVFGLKGSFVIDADVANSSTTPIAGRYNGAIKDLKLTFASTPTRNAVTLSTANFTSGTNRNQIFVGPRGTREELQFLVGNVGSAPPFFLPDSFGIIFTNTDLPLTTQLKEVLIPASSTFTGQFKLTLSDDQIATPNNDFSGSLTITPVSVPEPKTNTALVLLSLGFTYYCWLKQSRPINPKTFSSVKLSN